MKIEYCVASHGCMGTSDSYTFSKCAEVEESSNCSSSSKHFAWDKREIMKSTSCLEKHMVVRTLVLRFSAYIEECFPTAPSLARAVLQRKRVKI